MDEYKFRQQQFINEWNLKQSRSFIKERYPDVDDISIKLDFTYIGIDKMEKSKTLRFTPNDKEYFKFDCINPECVDTDLDLSREIQTMIFEKKSILKGKKTCNGYQDYERFRAKSFHCLTTMNYEIEIKYK
jgi:hypothetical protein